MDVTIVIPTKNAGKEFSKVLKKIKEQDTKYKFEIICVDSGSCDDTVKIIKKNKVKLFEIKSSDFGHGKTRNYGASKGKGKYIVFITQDALPYDKKWLDNMINAMEENPDAVGCFGKHYPYKDCNIFDKKDINMLFQSFGNENTIYKIEDKNRYDIEEGYRHLLSFYSDNNSCMLRKIWEKYPYDDVDFAEDQLWAKKIIELGYSKLYCPTAGVYHSHNYPLKTYFSRYYDEYKGIYKLHKYFLVNRKKQLIGRCYNHIKSDWKYTLSLKDISLVEKMKWLMYALRREIYRYKAGYLVFRYYHSTKEIQNKMDIKYSQQYKQINKGNK